MKILTAILGIILVVLGFLCMFTPLSTFLATGYLIFICMLVFGIVGIIRMIATKIVRPLNLIVSILAIIFGIIAMVYPGSTLVFDGLVIYLMAIWFLVYGVFAIIQAIRARKVQKGWGWGIAAGIFGIITGILAIGHPIAAMVAAGIMIGFFFIETGWGLLAFGSFGYDPDGYVATGNGKSADAGDNAAEDSSDSEAK